MVEEVEEVMEEDEEEVDAAVVAAAAAGSFVVVTAVVVLFSSFIFIAAKGSADFRAIALLPRDDESHGQALLLSALPPGRGGGI